MKQMITRGIDLRRDTVYDIKKKQMIRLPNLEIFLITCLKRELINVKLVRMYLKLISNSCLVVSAP